MKPNFVGAESENAVGSAILSLHHGHKFADLLLQYTQQNFNGKIWVRLGQRFSIRSNNQQYLRPTMDQMQSLVCWKNTATKLKFGKWYQRSTARIFMFCPSSPSMRSAGKITRSSWFRSTGMKSWRSLMAQLLLTFGTRCQTRFLSRSTQMPPISRLQENIVRESSPLQIRFKLLCELNLPKKFGVRWSSWTIYRGNVIRMLINVRKGSGFWVKHYLIALWIGIWIRNEPM